MSGSERGTLEGVSIRQATPGDVHVIENLRRLVGWSTTETGLTSMMAGRSIVFLLEIEGAPAASGALVLRADDPELADGQATALVSNLIVAPQFQSRGLGTRLLAFLEDEARRRGFQRISIGVDSVNERARTLYERHGYQRTKDKTEAWGPVNYLAKSL